MDGCFTNRPGTDAKTVCCVKQGALRTVAVLHCAWEQTVRAVSHADFLYCVIVF